MQVILRSFFVNSLRLLKVLKDTQIVCNMFCLITLYLFIHSFLPPCRDWTALQCESIVDDCREPSVKRVSLLSDCMKDKYCGLRLCKCVYCFLKGLFLEYVSLYERGCLGKLQSCDLWMKCLRLILLRVLEISSNISTATA